MRWIYNFGNQPQKEQYCQILCTSMRRLPAILVAFCVAVGSQTSRAFDCGNVVDVSQIECLALDTLSANTNVAGWDDTSGGWNDAGDTTVCDAYGVTCLAGGIHKLKLQENGLVGTLPPELGNLENLHELQINRNQLSGGIPPELGKLTDLERLVLSSNGLTGPIPSELSSLHNLWQLFLIFNQLSGEIPSELGKLSSLTDLSLFLNQLTGPIPPELANLTNLERLWLEENYLTGNIPVALTTMSNLKTLWLTNNQLTGTIPSALGDMPSLEVLHLNKNQLTGSIPRELGNSNTLSHIRLETNQLFGSIPAELGNLHDLFWLDLGHNNLTGLIPSSVGRLTNLAVMNLNNNQLSGSVPPQIGNMESLQGLYLYNNQFSGDLPDTMVNLTNMDGIHSDLRIQNNCLTESNPKVRAFIDSKSSPTDIYGLDNQRIDCASVLVKNLLTPVNGLWSIVKEDNGRPGRGFQLETQNDVLVLTVYGYTRSGDAKWWLAAGALPIDSNEITLDLGHYSGGTSFGMEHVNALYLGSQGRVTLRFDRSTSGEICFPDESCKAIHAFKFGWADSASALLGNWVGTAVDRVSEELFAFDLEFTDVRNFRNPGVIDEVVGFGNVIYQGNQSSVDVVCQRIVDSGNEPVFTCTTELSGETLQFAFDVNNNGMAGQLYSLTDDNVDADLYGFRITSENGRSIQPN